MRPPPLLAFAAVALAAALAPAQSTAFTYQGELAVADAPASGLFDLRFRVFNAPAGGAEVGSPSCFDDVPVTNGLFAVTLDPASLLPGPLYRGDTDLWLEIQVRTGAGFTCASLASFQTLAPRQPLSRAPFANHAHSANTLVAPDGVPNPAVYVSNAGSVGINTTSPQAPFEFTNTNGSYVRFDANGALHMGGSGGLSQIFNDAPSNGQTLFRVGAASPLAIGTGGIGVNGAAPPASGLSVIGPSILGGDVAVGGQITMGATTRYLSLHAAAFSPERGGQDTGWAPGNALFGPDGVTVYTSSFNDDYIAPVCLPDGATITNFIASVVDNNASNDIIADLGRSSILTGATGTMASGASGGNSTIVQIIGSAAIASPIVDNSTYVYWARVKLNGGASPNTHRLIGVRITYSISRPLP
jgi:hypothetical protein